MADTRQRIGALGVAVGSFESMAELPDFEAKRKALLRKCDAAYALGQVGRSYVDKAGEQHSQPDVSACIKCIELAARILGVIAEAEKRAKAGDDPSGVDIEQLITALRAIGYRIEKAA